VSGAASTPRRPGGRGPTASGARRARCCILRDPRLGVTDQGVAERPTFSFWKGQSAF